MECTINLSETILEKLERYTQSRQRPSVNDSIAELLQYALTIIPQNPIGDIIERIVEEHFDIETGLQEVAVYSTDDDSVLRLLEVNNETLPTGQVQPFVFSPNDEVQVPIIIADVTSEEWKKIQEGRISLPKGWPAQPSKIFHRT